MQVFVGADYRGLERKNQLIPFLIDSGYSVEDLGEYEYIEGSDFNDPAIKVAKKVRENPGSFGILICDSAHGVTMQANRFKGIRAANCAFAESAKPSSPAVRRCRVFFCGGGSCGAGRQDLLSLPGGHRPPPLPKWLRRSVG